MLAMRQKPSHRDRVIHRVYAHNKGKSGVFSLVSMSAPDAVICERQISQLRPFAKSHGGCSATSLSETISLGLPRYSAVCRSWLRHFFWRGVCRELDAGCELSGERRRESVMFGARCPIMNSAVRPAVFL